MKARTEHSAFWVYNREGAGKFVISETRIVEYRLRKANDNFWDDGRQPKKHAFVLF